MASITVDVDLGDFDLDELLDEIINRSFYPLYKQDIEDWAKDMFDIEPFNENRKLSLLDKIKIDFLMDNLDKIKLNDLENLI
jgi:hypothetical protein